MKMRLPVLIIALSVMALLAGIQLAYADLVWQLPLGIGTVQVPTGPADIIPVVGFDAIQKELIAGPSASLVTLWKEINGYAGAVGSFQTKGPYIQPYLAIGSDFARYVPALRQIQNLEIHAFVRYIPTPETNKSNYGAGGALAYRFGPSTPVIPQAPSQPPAPAATLPPVPVTP
jgi:hypothetical protein